MPGYRGHIAGAGLFFALYVVLANALSLETIMVHSSFFEGTALYFVILLTIAVMFGLWPDVDTNSKGQNVFYTLFFIVDLVLIWQQQYRLAAYLGLFAILPALGKHRGWTHTWWAMLAIPLPLLVVPSLLNPADPYAGVPFYGAAVIGYLSHLVFDGELIKKRR